MLYSEIDWNHFDLYLKWTEGVFVFAGWLIFRIDLYWLGWIVGDGEGRRGILGRWIGLKVLDGSYIEKREFGEGSDSKFSFFWIFFELWCRGLIIDNWVLINIEFGYLF